MFRIETSGGNTLRAGYMKRTDDTHQKRLQLSGARNGSLSVSLGHQQTDNSRPNCGRFTLWCAFPIAAIEEPIINVRYGGVR